jgi:hypothetical protein
VADFGNAVRGAASTTGSTATTLIAAPAADQSIYVGSAQFSNSSATGTTVTLNDTAATVLWVPTVGTISLEFTPPLKVPVGLPLTFKPGGSTTTFYAAAQGWIQ